MTGKFTFAGNRLYQLALLVCILFNMGLPSRLAAQTMLPQPPHASLYTGSARGYWFTAPTNFTIVGLRVPIEAGTGLQYIHVMKLGTTPPIAFTAQSNNFTTLTYVNGAPSNVIQTVNIPVSTGDVIGILGTAGTGNSYATGGFATNINAVPVTLTRFGYQGNINTGPAPEYWGEAVSSTAQISRVEMYYTVGPPCPVVTGINTTFINSTSVNFGWTAVTGSVGYEYVVDQNATGPGAGTPTATPTPVGSKSGLTPGTQYYIHVRNKCTGNGQSQWVTFPFKTLPPCDPPTALIMATLTSTSATFTWTAGTTATSYEYIVNQSTATPAPGTVGIPTATAFGSAGPLTEGTTYYVHIRTRCTGDDSSGWYLDSFYTPVDCRVTDVKFTDVTSNRSVAYWQPVKTAISYDYVLNEDPAAHPSWSNTINTSVLLPYLDNGADYYLHIRTVCSDRGIITASEWRTYNFATHRLGITSNHTEDKGVAIFPNPANDFIVVSKADGGHGTLSIISLNGAELLRKNIDDRETRVDIKALASGVYLVKYADDNGTLTTRLIKK